MAIRSTLNPSFVERLSLQVFLSVTKCLKFIIIFHAYIDSLHRMQRYAYLLHKKWPCKVPLQGSRRNTKIILKRQTCMIDKNTHYFSWSQPFGYLMRTVINWSKNS